MYNNHSVEERVYSALDSALLSGSNPAQTLSHLLDASWGEKQHRVCLSTWGISKDF